MAVRVRQITRTTQPQEYAPLSEWARGLGIKLAYTPGATRSSLNGPTVATGPYGLHLTNSASSSYGDTVKNPSLSGSDLTVMVLGRVTTQSANTNGWMFAIPHHGSWTAPYGAVLVGINTAGGPAVPMIHFGDSGGGFEQLIGSIDDWPIDSSWHWFEVTRTGTAVAFYLDGAAKGTTTATKTPDYSNYQDVQIWGTPAPSSNEAPQGDCAVVVVAEVPLSDAVRREIRANPWRLFESEQIVVKSGTATAVTASIAATQAADTSAVAGTVNNRASLAPTQAADAAAIGATVANRAVIAPTQAADVSALVGEITQPVTVAIDVIQAADNSAIVVSVPSRNVGAGKSRSKTRRRRIEIDGRVYDVLERDVPALLEAAMLGRKPPKTAEVVKRDDDAEDASETRQEPAETAEIAWSMPEPVQTVDAAQERYAQMMAQIQSQAAADVARILDRVAERVMLELQDEEEAVTVLLLH